MSTINSSNKMLIPYISKILNKRLSGDEIKYILSTNTNITRFNFQQVVDQIITAIKSGINVEEDIKEYLLNEINGVDGKQVHRYDTAMTLEVATFLTFTNEQLFNLSKKLNPSSKEYYSYLFLDSDNKRLADSTTTKFIWNVNDAAPILETGYLNVRRPIEDVVAMRISRVSINYLHEAAFTTIFTSASNRVSLHFSNFLAQHVLYPNGLKSHFLLKNSEIDRRGNSFVLSPFNANRGWFRFAEPHRMTDIIDLTLNDLFDLTPIDLPEVEFSFIATQTNHAFNIFDEDNSSDEIFAPLIINYPYRDMMPIIFKTSDSSDNLPNIFLRGPVDGIYDLSGFTLTGYDENEADNKAYVDAYNTGQSLILWGKYTDATSIYFESVISYLPVIFPVDPNPPPPIFNNGATIPANQSITVTFRFKPRFVATLELISRMKESQKLL